MKFFRCFVASAVIGIFFAACTPGGIQPGGSVANAPTVPLTGRVVNVDVNLTLHGVNGFNPDTLANVGGYAPAMIQVNVGDAIVFTNSDSFRHTATFIGTGLTTFPTPGTDAGLNQNVAAGNPVGSALSQYWTSGMLEPSTSSQHIIVDKPGTYLFGCAYHYPSGMRGEIIAQ